MVDIVVTYLNGRDEKWQKDFKYWKDKEITEGIQTPDNRQAFGEERTREWDILKYWFRGIESNCSWINKIFLVVQNERHIPKWLNTDNTKLRVVYHDEFIPKELLPTFNAMTIGMYVSNISDLSETYIMFDDDYYVLNPVLETRFFKFNRPVHPNNVVNYQYYGTDGTDGVFFGILNNNLRFEERFNKRVKYGFYHLPEARLKSVEQKILKDYGEEIKNHNLPSKFRSKNNLCPYMFDDLLKIFQKTVTGNPYENSCYCNLDSKVDFNYYWDKAMVCFNDTERLDNYEKTKEKLIEFLEKKFPNKCSFEN